MDPRLRGDDDYGERRLSAATQHQSEIRELALNSLALAFRRSGGEAQALVKDNRPTIGERTTA